MTKEEILIMYAPLTYLLIPKSSQESMVGDDEKLCDCIFDRIKLYLMCNPEKISILYSQLYGVLPEMIRDLTFRRDYYEETDSVKKSRLAIFHRAEKFEQEIKKEMRSNA